MPLVVPGLGPDNLLAGRYRLTEVLGRGGMSTVYRAIDTVLGRAVAVKLLTSLEADPAAVERATSEIRVLASLAHRGLVTLYDASTATVGGVSITYLVMELVDGPSLADTLRQRLLTEEETLLLATDLAEALHVIHARGVTHRDIKPANILLGPGAYSSRPFEAKLADFGIAMLSARTTDLTAAGTIVGTAAYLSPEQPRGQPATSASDIYSLGLVLLEALTGRQAFPGTLAETVAARMNRAPDVPATLDYRWRSLLGAMTALLPEDRPSASEVMERLAGPTEPDATMPAIPISSSTKRLPVTPTDATEVVDSPSLAAASRADSDLERTTVLGRTPEAVQAGGVAAVSAAGSRTKRPRSSTRRRRTVVGGIVAACLIGAVVSVAAVLGLGRRESPAADPVAPSTQPSEVGSSAPVSTSPKVTSPVVVPPASTPASSPTTPASATSVPVPSPVGPGNGGTPGNGGKGGKPTGEPGKQNGNGKNK